MKTIVGRRKTLLFSLFFAYSLILSFVSIIPMNLCFADPHRHQRQLQQLKRSLFHCDNKTTCIDRSRYKIRAIVHGRSNDHYWQEMKTIMTEIAIDIGLDFDMILQDSNIDSYDIPQKMVNDIQNAARLRLSAILVSTTTSSNLFDGIGSVVNDPRVMQAIENVQDTIPVFSLDSIIPYSINNSMTAKQQQEYELDEQLQLMEDYILQVVNDDVNTFDNQEVIDGILLPSVYINHEPGIISFQDLANSTISILEDLVDWTVIETDQNKMDLGDELISLFNGCNYTLIQLAGPALVEATIDALMENGCEQDNHIVGTFGTSPLTFDAITAGIIQYTISSQQQYKYDFQQAKMALITASLYVTTGQKILNNYNIDMNSNPTLITADNLVQPALLAPVSNNKRLIKVVIHENINDPFWDTIYAGLYQASNDLNIQLETHRMKYVRAGRQDIRLEGIFYIQEACQSRNIDGLIVSLPYNNMMNALSICHERGIPIFVINALSTSSIEETLSNPTLMTTTSPSINDDDSSNSTQYFYIGQYDYESGYQAGKLLEQAGVKYGWCLIHTNFDTLKNRCHGMEKAFTESNEEDVNFMGILHVNVNDQEYYRNSLENEIGKDDNDWNNTVGILSTGQIQIPLLHSLIQEHHPNVIAGTFDVYMSEENKNGSLFLFEIEQQPYLQGYLSVLLASGIGHLNSTFETGPIFVDNTTADGQRTLHCYQACDNNMDIGGVKSQLPALKYSGKCKTLGRKCEICEGDCDEDADCANGLECFVRDSKTLGAYQAVPGCSTNPFQLNAKDFCVDASLYDCKDEEPFLVQDVGSYFSSSCQYVADDLSRCTMYGIYCRETCGYCRSRRSIGEGRE